MNNKKVFNNFENNKKRYDYKKTKVQGPFMNEFAEDIISEVVQNEVHVKSKNKTLKKDHENENNSSNN